MMKVRKASSAKPSVRSRAKPIITAKKVYELTSQIPKGKVSTYGAIAGALNSWGGARAVGQILKRNPTPIVVPCHRVVKSDGGIGGYGGPKGYPKKIELLRSEGLIVNETMISNLEDVLFTNFRTGGKARSKNRRIPRS